MSQTRGGGSAAVKKYLLPRELQHATVRRHPAILIGPTALAVGGLLLAAVLSVTIISGALVWVVWAAWAALLLNLAWQATNWAVDYFVVTSERILLTSGILTRKVAMMPLSKVTDMSFQRSFAGRLLGYGDFIVESAGQDQALRTVDHIPYPEQLYLLICGILFPDSDALPPADEEPDEDDLNDPDEFDLEEEYVPAGRRLFGWRRRRDRYAADQPDPAGGSYPAEWAAGEDPYPGDQPGPPDGVYPVEWRTDDDAEWRTDEDS
jgi:membrane protein YdbS with pleckstrin-like domain